MDNFENDVEGDRLLASLSFDELTGMQSNEDTLPVFKPPKRIDFPGFPYSPYPQQLELMRFLYASLAASKCCIIESPTGTGKSLTLLTGSLHWLIDHNKAISAHLSSLRNYLQMEINRPEDGADWVEIQSRKRALRLKLAKEMEPLEDTQKALAEASELIKRAEDIRAFSKSEKQSALNTGSFSLLSDARIKADDDEFLPQENSQADNPGATEVTKAQFRVVQIIYCSRTHSQLSQVAEELSKVKDISDGVTVLSLASRHHLCVNKAVYELKNAGHVREACLDLAGKSPGCKFRCKNDVALLSDYLLGARISAADATAKIRKIPDGVDIEDLPVRACPYYANKRGLPLAQVILAPYQTVVVPSSREAAGVCLRGNVLIFDEAHNLLEAVAAAFSVTVSYYNLLATEHLVNTYLNHYRDRLSSLSVLRLRQLVMVVRGFANLLEGRKARSWGSENLNSASEAIFTLHDFLFAAGLDHINLSYIVDYLRRERCVHKIAGFGKWFGSRRKRKNETPVSGGEEGQLQQQQQPGKQLKLCGLSFSDCLNQLKRPVVKQSEEALPKPLPNAVSFKKGTAVETTQVSTEKPLGVEDLPSAGGSLFAVLGLLEALVTSHRDGEDDGRLIVTPLTATTSSTPTTTSERPSGWIRFGILNPGRYLHDAVREARSVVLVGGTMKPFDEFIEQVFHPAGKAVTEIAAFSCGHVIDAKRQLLIYTPTASPKNITWDFTFKNRNDPRLIYACGEFLVEICKSIPGGVVVFFPSFDYLAAVWNRWKSSGLLSRLQVVKTLFREPRSTGALLEVMQAYSAAVTGANKRGACIVCVIGGRLSEGINFNDDLARGVVVVGLPYPNIYSAFMREKLRYLERRFGGREGGRRFCEATCMRAVNQAVGRAVRHARDFAAVFLLDRRLVAQPRLRSLLPEWARPALAAPHGGGCSSPVEVLRRALDDFFLQNRAT